MTEALVECIPNFSEGRRPEVVEAIVAAIKAVDGVLLLDYSSDGDHNRSVATFVGPPEAVEEAAFRGIAKAAELIDLDQHQGEHPRIGATDVVPFVPIAGVSMEDCVQIAQRLGQRVGKELSIPVYLYEEAATRPERRNLANIRKGEYEALKNEIGSNPERAPDYGPAKVGPAGATVIGARQFLIAYNVYLTTDDVSIAKEIAKAVRFSSGGLPYVKALGMLVEGRAQVSMNLTNFRQTPVFKVVEAIRGEAESRGVGVHSSELIGLIPQDALIDSAKWYLQLEDLKPQQILEQQIRAAQAEAGGAQQSTDDFLAALAAGTATPGGGSAAAYGAAMAAALVAMVARLTIGKKKYAQVEAKMKDVLGQAEGLQKKLHAAVADDAAAFEAVMKAFRLPKETEKQKETRAKAVEAATVHAAEVPLDVARQAVRVLELATEVVEMGNLNAITDGATAGALARAALRAAGMNVRINLSSLEDKAIGDKLAAALQELEERAAGIEPKITAALGERAELSIP